MEPFLWGFLQLCLATTEMVPSHCATASSETSCQHFSYYRIRGRFVAHKCRTALHCSWWLNWVIDVPDRCLTHSAHHCRLLHQIKSLIFITWATSIIWTAIMRPVIIDWSASKCGTKKIVCIIDVTASRNVFGVKSSLIRAGRRGFNCTRLSKNVARNSP